MLRAGTDRPISFREVSSSKVSVPGVAATKFNSVVIWRPRPDDKQVETHRRGDDVTPTMTAGPLTAADRCDRCGAQAYVRATMTSGLDLLLCAHHFRENEERLREVAASIYDESDRLAEVPGTAALEER